MTILTDIDSGRVLASFEIVDGKMSARFFDKRLRNLLTNRGIWDGQAFVTPSSNPKRFMSFLSSAFGRNSKIAVGRSLDDVADS